MSRPTVYNNSNISPTHMTSAVNSESMCCNGNFDNTVASHTVLSDLIYLF